MIRKPVNLVLFYLVFHVCVAAFAKAQLAPPQLNPATAADSAVELKWGGVPSATSFNIYWSPTTHVTKANAAGTVNTTGVAYTVPGLTNGTTYYFVVTAVDAAGESAASNEVSQTPQPAAAAKGVSTPQAQPTTNVGHATDTNIQNPTMNYTVFPPSSYTAVATTAGTPSGKITYDVTGVEKLIKDACSADFKSAAEFDQVFKDSQTYTIVNVINLVGDANAQNVSSNNWYIYSKGKTFLSGFAGGWQLGDFDGATRLYGAKRVLLLSLLENNLSPATQNSPSISYTLTVTRQQPTNLANVFQLLGLVFPQAKAAGLPAAPASYWACSDVPVAYKTSSIKIDLSYTAGGGSPYTASQSFTSETKQRWDVSFALPIKKASALQYSSTANTVTASQINKTDLFAVADFYPYPVDLANSRFTFIPGFFGGVAMNSQPLHSLIFGGSVGLKLAQVYVGALLIKQQQLNGLSTGSSASGAQVASATTYAYKPSFTVGIKISVKAAAAAIAGSKK